MKVLILSDSHGAKNYLDRLVPIIKNEIDLVIHAGDNFRDSIYLKNKTEKPIMAVVGNCDFENTESELEFDCEGIKIFLTHGHSYGVKYSLNKLVHRAEKLASNLVIFGHTHCKDDRIVSGIQILNPGSLSLPRDCSRGSYVIMDIDGSNFTYEYKYV